MHLRTNNKSLCYRLRAHLLEITEEEKNLGILASHRITINYQSNVAAKKGNVNRSSTSRMDKEK